MAIVFAQQKKIQRSLILIFVIVILITAIVIWQGFSKKEIEIPTEGVTIFPREEVKIDFEILKNPVLKELWSFPEIEPFKEIISAEGKPIQKVGRENPFLPF